MVALQINRSGFSFFTIQCPTGYTWYLLIANDGLSIGNYSNHSAYKGNIETLPFIGSKSCIFTGHQKTINTTKQMAVGMSISRIVNNLCFISASQIHTAIAFGLKFKFNMQFE